MSIIDIPDPINGFTMLLFQIYSMENRLFQQVDNKMKNAVFNTLRNGFTRSYKTTDVIYNAADQMIKVELYNYVNDDF